MRVINSDNKDVNLSLFPPDSYFLCVELVDPKTHEFYMRETMAIGEVVPIEPTSVEVKHGPYHTLEEAQRSRVELGSRKMISAKEHILGIPDEEPLRYGDLSVLEIYKLTTGHTLEKVELGTHLQF